MSTFLIIAVAMTALALACVLFPLLRAAPGPDTAALDNLQVLREQARELDASLKDGMLTPAAHAEALEELKRRVGEEAGSGRHGAGEGQQRLLAGALALFVPLVAAGLYYHLGSPAALAVADPEASIGKAQHEISAADVSTLVERLAARMRANPADADGWYMLARTYTAIGRYQDAVLAYERLLVLVPDDSAVLADYADVLATVQGGSFAGKPELLVAQALKHDPQDVKALALAGSAAYQKGDMDAARRHWNAVLPLVPADTDLHRNTLASLARIQPSASATGTAALAKGAQAARLEGTVSLAPELASSVSPNDTVFIFAKAATGPGLPLAVKRVTVAQLPFTFVLDDSSAMSPQARLSAASEVVVTARVSRSGSAVAASGDLEGRSGAVAPTARGVSVRIDSRVD